MSWENWIKREITREANLRENNYDDLCEYISHKWNLNNRTRKQSHIDNVQCFLKWWKKNIKKMHKYDTTSRISHLIGRDRCVVSHYLTHRKKSFDYQKNTEELRAFLNP